MEDRRTDRSSSRKKEKWRKKKDKEDLPEPYTRKALSLCMYKSDRVFFLNICNKKKQKSKKKKSYDVCITEHWISEHAKLIPTMAVNAVTCIERERE